MDDLATDAASKAAFVQGLRMAGATVEDAVVLFYHRVFAGGAERLESLGLTLHALADWTDVLRLGVLPAEDRAVLERFLADPEGWSALHGGRGQRVR